jgi:hypothetical protein
MAIQLPDKLTQLAPDDAARELAEAYFRVMGKRPTVAKMKLLISQSALESGNWKLMHNWNFGNEKLSGSDSHSQIYNISDDPADPSAFYAAFLNPADGAEHYVRTLTKRDHWREGLESGKPLQFIQALSTPPVYFTADPQRYLVTMTNLIDQYEDLAVKYGSSTVGTIFGLLLALGSGASVYLLLRK